MGTVRIEPPPPINPKEIPINKAPKNPIISIIPIKKAK
jgi:hypothetical protein